jgi:uncharacterized membrane protein YidH (DUF202 family)
VTNVLPPEEPAESQVNDWGYELLLHGNEEILRGSDTGTLVAFAALAYQQIKGQAALHHNVGCGLLLLSVLLCAVVHLVMGNAYVKRAKKIIRRNEDLKKLLLSRRLNVTLAWVAVGLQFVLAVSGTLLVLVNRPPPLIDRLIKWMVS